jgi:general secretion pathway protein G
VVKQMKKQQSGFTLVEILVVFAMIALLVGLVGPKVMQALGGAKSKTAHIQIRDLEQGLEIFKLDVGRFPNTSEGLQALQVAPGGASGWNGPYMRTGIPKDPWGKDYMYKYPTEKGGFDLYSYGADGGSGGSGEDADVHNVK